MKKRHCGLSSFTPVLEFILQRGKIQYVLSALHVYFTSIYAERWFIQPCKRLRNWKWEQRRGSPMCRHMSVSQLCHQLWWIAYDSLNHCLAVCFDWHVALILVFADETENMLLRYFYQQQIQNCLLLHSNASENHHTGVPIWRQYRITQIFSKWTNAYSLRWFLSVLFFFCILFIVLFYLNFIKHNKKVNAIKKKHYTTKNE